MRRLEDLRGRSVRTPSTATSEWVSGLGAVPVLTPFAEIVPEQPDAPLHHVTAPAFATAPLRQIGLRRTKLPLGS